jgi:hypothetical protein
LAAAARVVRTDVDDEAVGPTHASRSRYGDVPAHWVESAAHDLNFLTGGGGANVEHASDLNRREQARTASWGRRTRRSSSIDGSRSARSSWPIAVPRPCWRWSSRVWRASPCRCRARWWARPRPPATRRRAGTLRTWSRCSGADQRAGVRRDRTGTRDVGANFDAIRRVADYPVPGLELLVSPVPGQGSEDCPPARCASGWSTWRGRRASTSPSSARGSPAQQAADRVGRRLHARAFLVTMMTSLALDTTQTARAPRATSVGQRGSASWRSAANRSTDPPT